MSKNEQQPLSRRQFLFRSAQAAGGAFAGLFVFPPPHTTQTEAGPPRPTTIPSSLPITGSDFPTSQEPTHKIEYLPDLIAALKAQGYEDEMANRIVTALPVLIEVEAETGVPWQLPLSFLITENSGKTDNPDSNNYGPYQIYCNLNEITNGQGYPVGKDNSSEDFKKATEDFIRFIEEHKLSSIASISGGEVELPSIRNQKISDRQLMWLGVAYNGALSDKNGIIPPERRPYVVNLSSLDDPNNRIVMGWDGSWHEMQNPGVYANWERLRAVDSLVSSFFNQR